MFRDRTEAGTALAEKLAQVIHGEALPGDPLVLALPRGGVPVAFEVARRLSAPLDLVLVRKIGVPGQPELAAAAVVDGAEPQLVVNRDVVAATGMTTAELDAARRRELTEIERRREAYLAGRAPVSVEGRMAIVVDDGIATGATMRAALKALRRRHPTTLVLAVPVAPADTLEDLAGEVDRVVCLETPGWFRAVGMHYAHFDQTSDAEVVRLMQAAANLVGGSDMGSIGGKVDRE